MTVRPLLAVLVAAVLVPSGAAHAGAPASRAAAGASVTVANMAFSPNTVTVAVGDSVDWTFKDPVAHTTTSDDGFWNSGTRSGGATYVRTFTSAGTFAYHCTIHPMMRGKVRVPVSRTGSPSAGWKLRWATAKATGGITFDVKTKLGKGRWTLFKAGVTRAKAKFNPARPGRYKVKARTVKGGQRSGWSPAVTVTIS